MHIDDLWPLLSAGLRPSALPSLEPLLLQTEQAGLQPLDTLTESDGGNITLFQWEITQSSHSLRPFTPEEDELEILAIGVFPKS